MALLGHSPRSSPTTTEEDAKEKKHLPSVTIAIKAIVVVSATTALIDAEQL